MSKKRTGHSPHPWRRGSALAAIRFALTLSFTVASGPGLAQAETQAVSKESGQAEPEPKILKPADPFITVSHKWDKAVRGFRKGHNFGLLGAYRRTAFQLSGGGTRREVSRQLLVGQLRYAYHIQSDRSVGYFLGSTLGYVEPQSRGPQRLEYQRYMEFPSLMIGGVFNGSSYFRLHTYFEGFLTRLEGFNRNPLVNAIDTTGETIRAGMGFDLFYFLEWGVTFNASYYWSKLRVPKPESDAAHDVDAVIISGNSFAVGLVLHLI